MAADTTIKGCRRGAEPGQVPSTTASAHLRPRARPRKRSAIMCSTRSVATTWRRSSYRNGHGLDAATKA